MAIFANSRGAGGAAAPLPIIYKDNVDNDNR